MASVRVYLLVQRPLSGKEWHYFSIVQDQTREPALDYYAELKKEGPKFEGASCYKCHSSGPLAIQLIEIAFTPRHDFFSLVAGALSKP